MNTQEAQRLADLKSSLSDPEAQQILKLTKDLEASTER